MSRDKVTDNRGMYLTELWNDMPEKDIYTFIKNQNGFDIKIANDYISFHIVVGHQVLTIYSWPKNRPNQWYCKS